jgi:hypothetical protein
MMQLMSVALRPLNPALARQIQAGVVMDTRPMAFDAAGWRRESRIVSPQDALPQVRLHRLARTPPHP